MTKKHLGDKIYKENANWSFGDGMAQHFDEHIQKSIPLYDKANQLIAQISDFFLSHNSICYDLGCATGTLETLICNRHPNKNITMLAIDQEAEMIAQAQKKGTDPRVKFIKADLLEIEFEPADLIIANYTIQFIKPKYRQILINQIYKALNWGGGFLMFEKVRGPDARFQDMMTSLYTEYKLEKGFSPSEITAKTNSLKGILEPFSTQGNLDLLARAGFVDIMTVMKFICFEGFLAIK